MPTKRFAHLLKPLECTEQDDVNLRELAETLIVHNMEQFDSLELKNGAPADKVRWKEIRRKEDTRVFIERATKEGPLEMPSLMLLGTVVGTLEDVMYAVVDRTTEAMRVKAAIIQDGVVDCKFLYEAVRPTMDDPFHQIAVKWRFFVDPEARDHVCVDASGIATSAKGERIGYHLAHSIGFDQIPSFASYGVSRANMSVCSLYVQRSPSIVQTYARGYYDFSNDKNRLLNNASLNAIAAQWLGYSRKIECAQMKKLLWTMYKYNNPESIMSLTDEDTPNAPVFIATPGLCKVCSKSFGFLGTSRKCCKACNAKICSRCSVAKKVVKLAPNKMSVIEKKRFFCLQCFNDAVRVDAVRLAREEILNAKQGAVYY
ncbi:hypothetical protein PHYBOEH_003880 [Phytophthora boehmeriae]|uniref:FYVE-type domain-containing protein n=1 Tax=Phytophthora boehmeriae TaxID=109152 RepID=A0A8T1WUN5_9STRA|nr:hypothetical protein PHYBOEH_003880 [Phytophthora boehmeriae]